jgi:hypothetical protein
MSMDRRSFVASAALNFRAPAMVAPRSEVDGPDGWLAANADRRPAVDSGFNLR